MVDAVTILTSAAVAGVVTLGIEYTAKPYLEARKDEILDERRLKREVRGLLLQAKNNLEILEEFRKHVERVPEHGRATIEESDARIRAELAEQSYDLVRKARLLAPRGSPLGAILSATAAAVQVTAELKGQVLRGHQLAPQGADLSLALLDPPRGRRRRAALEAEVTSWLVSNASSSAPKGS